MKKRLFPILITGLSILVVGIIITTLGVANGGIVYMKHVQVGPFSSFIWDSSSKNMEKHTYTSKEDVTSITLDADLGDIILQPATTFSIETKGINLETIDFQENKGEVYFDTSSNSFEISIIPFISQPQRKIIVHVPPSCKELYVRSNLGDVDVRDLDVSTLQVDLDLGKLKATNVNIDSGDISLNLGDLEFKGSFTKQLLIQNNLGDVEVQLSGESTDYNMNLKTSLGTIYLDGEEYSPNKSTNESDKTLHIMVDLGDIHLFFK